MLLPYVAGAAYLPPSSFSSDVPLIAFCRRREEDLSHFLLLLLPLRCSRTHVFVRYLGIPDPNSHIFPRQGEVKRRRGQEGGSDQTGRKRERSVFPPSPPFTPHPETKEISVGVILAVCLSVVVLMCSTTADVEAHQNKLDPFFAPPSSTSTSVWPSPDKEQGLNSSAQNGIPTTYSQRT